ncbi:nuclear transport factor 2 family protein [Paractinoplanes lichenicola]|uniref:nuclear transport factor 2 family protein n=1 Tax=Paractinoplanes lichenicola TaxID=2802976 RepID=UPI001F1CA433|nr:nuclear transport factor 2 family protein [Actinoplanes lichenicola]
MTAANKDLIQRALTVLLETRDTGALAPFLSNDFVHHRPGGFRHSKAEWLDAVGAALEPLADMQVEIRHLLADDDRVVMYSRRTLPAAEIEVVDIWRIDDGLIAEGWEVLEPAAQVAANQTWWEPSAA